MSTVRQQECSRCILDHTIPGISFNQNGLCNFCERYDATAKRYHADEPEKRDQKFREIIQKIKVAGEGKPYDCILGLSGGVDSSYMAYLAKQEGLRPLVVHFDNGWNSELAVMNIQKIVSTLGFDLYTYVIDWEEFKDLQMAYLKASVVDVEVPTDQLIIATLYRLAKKHGIRYILEGTNYETELIMPPGWNYSRKLDLINLRNIHKAFGTRKLRNFPKLGYYQRYYYQKVLGIEGITLLNYVAYKKNDIKQLIQEKLGWIDYGGKHYESIFTRFYQGYLLPVKFGIDKRKAHVANLICSKQMTKAEAHEILATDPYPDQEQKAMDREYVIKKFGISEAEFNDIINAPIRSHEEFGTEVDDSKQHYYFERIVERLKPFLGWMLKGK